MHSFRFYFSFNFWGVCVCVCSQHLLFQLTNEELFVVSEMTEGGGRNADSGGGKECLIGVKSQDAVAFIFSLASHPTHLAPLDLTLIYTGTTQTDAG